MKINPAVAREVGTYPAPSSSDFDCPESCDCFAEDFDDIRSGCLVELRCSKVPSRYPLELDCLTINDESIAEYTVQAKQDVLSAIPKGNLLYLDLAFCGFGAGSGFPRGTPFEGFTALRFLNLEFNSIEELFDTSFKGLPALRTLWLTVCLLSFFFVCLSATPMLICAYSL